MRFIALAVLLCGFTLPIAAAVPSTESVLSRMDDASASFKGMSAGIKRVTHTAVINDSSEETGTVTMLRLDPRDVRMLIEFTAPDQKSIAFQQRKAQIYYPKLQQVEIYDLGKYSKLVDQFLLLGFGTSGRDLAKSYDMKVLGEETVAGKQTVKLELVPKSSEARQQLNKVELWLDEEGAYPVQQKFYQPGGDYIFITYTGVKLNLALSPAAVTLQLPKNVKKVNPQK
jgi:outer membrane lipoprotein-sorting protein